MTDSEDAARLDVLRAQLARDPGDGPAAFEFASLAARHGLEEEALPVVERAATIVSRSPRLYQWAGVLSRAIDRNDLAMRYFSVAAHIEPSDAKLAYARALATLEAGLAAEALFDKALALAPLDENALLGRAAARIARGRIDLARDEVEAVLAAHPGWLKGHERAAQLRWMSGDTSNFTRSIVAALGDTPADPALWRTLLGVLTRANLYEVVQAVAQRARAVSGPDRAYTLAEAVAASELGDTAAADAAFAALASGGNAEVLVRKTRHMLRTGRVEAAAQIAEAQTLTENAQQFWPYLGTAWRLLSDPRWHWLEGDPRLIATYDLSTQIPNLDALATRLTALHGTKIRYFEQSVRGGTQTDGPLFARVDPEIRALRDQCVEAVRRHVALLPPADAAHPFLSVRRDRPVRFSGSWSVRLTGAGHHRQHIHPQGWLSSALHVAVPATAQRGGGKSGWLTLGQPPAELGLDLPPIAEIEPVAGRLTLFPSQMWHGTYKFTAGERLTVAFDVARPID